MKYLITIVLFLFLIIGCGDDSIEKLTTVEESLEVKPVDDVIPLIPVDNVTQYEVAPEIVLEQPAPDPAEAHIPLPILVIDLKVLDISSVDLLEKELGAPSNIFLDDVNEASMRFYKLLDGNIIRFIVAKDEVIIVSLYYRRGYPTAFQAARAAGFTRDRLKIRKQTDTIEAYTVVNTKTDYTFMQVNKDEYGVWSFCTIFLD